MDEPPGNRALIEVHVTDLKQLFHSLDPTPFRERAIRAEARRFDRLSNMTVQVIVSRSALTVQ